MDTGRRGGPITTFCFETFFFFCFEIFCFETFALNLSYPTVLSFPCLRSELALPCALLKQSRGGSQLLPVGFILGLWLRAESGWMRKLVTAGQNKFLGKPLCVHLQRAPTHVKNMWRLHSQLCYRASRRAFGIFPGRLSPKRIASAANRVLSAHHVGWLHARGFDRNCLSWFLLLLSGLSER